VILVGKWPAVRGKEKVMAFNVATTIDSNAAMITMSGELDGSMAPLFQREVEKAATQNVKRLVLLMSDLDYMSSAGLRVLLIAVQKMRGVDLYVIGARQEVKDTLQMSGLDRGFIMLDTYDPARP
jgi:anti-sigma B factor antagonist